MKFGIFNINNFITKQTGLVEIRKRQGQNHILQTSGFQLT